MIAAATRAFAVLDRATLRRGGRIVLRDLSCTVGAGQLLWLDGPNGVGKTTLLRGIAGLIAPERGSLSVSVARALADERPALDEDLTLAAALDWWRRLDRSDEPVAGVLARLGLAELADVPVRYLSSGQRRRAGIARVALSRAPLWLLDEPANALDADATVTLADLVERHLDAGGGVVMASHVPLGALQDRATILPLSRPADHAAMALGR